MTEVDLRHGDCLEVMREMAPDSVDSIVTDPPYGLSFMGKKWDYDVPGVEVWAECLRVLKPGGHLLSFAGTRTQHRMAVNIEDGGFDIRDMIAWVYGSGFPKSLDVSKAIDKAAGAERERIRGVRSGVVGVTYAGDAWSREFKDSVLSAEPITDAAKQWQGWGTALKPALEPITLARKPFKGTVAANVLEHGTGGVNVDGCRVGTAEDTRRAKSGHQDQYVGGEYDNTKYDAFTARPQQGRWPANLIHDGGEEVLELFPQTKSGSRKAGEYNTAGSDSVYGARGIGGMPELASSSGSAARFFYCPKAQKFDRDSGLEGFEEGSPPASARSKPAEGRNSALGNPRKNHHPTVKPTDLMRYLCRLVTPPGGIVLDPFMGSGSTGVAAKMEGFSFVGIERESEYVEIARSRIATVAAQFDLFGNGGG